MTEEDIALQAQWRALMQASSGGRRDALGSLAAIECILTSGSALNTSAITFLLEVCRRVRTEHIDPLGLRRPKGRQATEAHAEATLDTAHAVHERVHFGDSVDDAVSHVEREQRRPVQGTGGVVHKAYYRHRADALYVYKMFPNNAEGRLMFRGTSRFK